jgi:hypothetical protein
LTRCPLSKLAKAEVGQKYLVYFRPSLAARVHYAWFSLDLGFPNYNFDTAQLAVGSGALTVRATPACWDTYYPVMACTAGNNKNNQS